MTPLGVLVSLDVNQHAKWVRVLPEGFVRCILELILALDASRAAVCTQKNVSGIELTVCCHHAGYPSGTHILPYSRRVH